MNTTIFFNKHFITLLFIIISITLFGNDPIKEKHEKLGGEKGILGKPVMDNPSDTEDGGKFQTFKKGIIYWHPNTGAWAVRGKILHKYESMASYRGEMGYPLSDILETPNKKGKYCKFEGGNIYWSKKTKAHFVRGPILEKWGDYKFERGALGFPVSDELESSIKNGKFQNFENGHIYWSEKTGAHAVKGKIFDRWGELRWEQGKLGYPVSEELETPDQLGAKFQKFEHGNIYMSIKGVHAIYGEFLKKWGEYGYEQGNMGFPTSSILDVYDNIGKYALFEGGGNFLVTSCGCSRYLRNVVRNNEI